MREVFVVGGGPAGMLAALTAAQNGAAVTLVEPNEKLGRKLYITGKGRCNLTNDCTAAETLAQVPCNGKFLYSAMHAFPPAETMAFFTALGVPLKTERGRRVFPASDRAADVIDALFHALRRAGVRSLRARAASVETAQNSVTALRCDIGTFPTERVILATGGVSYPLTGSTGDGYAIAAALGHTVVAAKPSLVPLVAEGEDCPAMQGLSLRNVVLAVKDCKGKLLYKELGELIFTHFGLSGPLVLSASAHMRALGTERYTAAIDLKPALDREQLEARLLRDFQTFANRDFGNYLPELIPRLMIPVLARRAGIADDVKLHSVSKEARRRLVEAVKEFSITVIGARPIEEAIVTSGGIQTGEIDPKTMESKLVRGLYFAGELIDVDAYTGGFNLQIAWATGRAAGMAAGQEGGR